MNYSSLFEKRMSIRGTSSGDRALKMKIRQFEQYFNNSPAKEAVVIDGVDQYAIFQDQNQNNNKDLSDDKYMVVPLDSNMKTGSYIVWRNSMWMVFTEEAKTINSHKQAKVKDSNHYIKWMDGDKVVGNGKGYPAFIQNQTLYTLGISTSGNHSWIANAKMMMYLQDNPETRTLKLGQRIFIGGQVYQIMFRDYVSREGLINFLLEQDFVNENRDDVVNEIADYYTAHQAADEENPDIVGSVKEVMITGTGTAKIGSLVKYEANVLSSGTDLGEDITEWTIVDVDHVATVVEQTPQYMTIRIESNFQKVGTTISIIGKTSDGVIGSKAVQIISPY